MECENILSKVDNNPDKKFSGKPGDREFEILYKNPVYYILLLKISTTPHI
jgi:hypothetical protein